MHVVLVTCESEFSCLWHLSIHFHTGFRTDVNLRGSLGVQYQLSNFQTVHQSTISQSIIHSSRSISQITQSYQGTNQYTITWVNSLMNGNKRVHWLIMTFPEPCKIEHNQSVNTIDQQVSHVDRHIFKARVKEQSWVTQTKLYIPRGETEWKLGLGYQVGRVLLFSCASRGNNWIVQGRMLLTNCKQKQNVTTVCGKAVRTQ